MITLSDREWAGFINELTKQTRSRKLKWIESPILGLSAGQNEPGSDNFQAVIGEITLTMKRPKTSELQKGLFFGGRSSTFILSYEDSIEGGVYPQDAGLQQLWSEIIEKTESGRAEQFARSFGKDGI